MSKSEEAERKELHDIADAKRRGGYIVPREGWKPGPVTVIVEEPFYNPDDLRRISVPNVQR